MGLGRAEQQRHNDPERAKGKQNCGVEELAELGSADELNELIELLKCRAGQSRLPGRVWQATGLYKVVDVEKLDRDRTFAKKELKDELIDLCVGEATLGGYAWPLCKRVVVDTEPEVELSLVSLLGVGDQRHIYIVDTAILTHALRVAERLD